MKKLLHAVSLPVGNLFLQAKLPDGHLPGGNPCRESGMDEKKEHRRRRLLELLEVTYGMERGRIRRAAERIDCDRNYLSRLLSTPDSSGHKNMGEDFQDKIEKAFDLAPGWLDMPLGTPIIKAISGYGASAALGVPPPAVQAPTPAYLPNSPYDRACRLLKQMTPEALEEALGLIEHVHKRHRPRHDGAGNPVPAQRKVS